MMNQADIFKKIGVILNELQDQYEFLAKNPEQLSELELELFLANANFLADHVQIVKKINSQKPLMELPAASTKAPAIPASEQLFSPVEAKQPIPDSETKTFEFLLSEPEPTDKFEFEEEKPVNEIYDRPLSEEEAQIIERKQQTVMQPEETGPEPFLMPQQEPEIEEKPSSPIYTSYTEVIADKVEEKEVAPVPTKALELDKPEEKLVAHKQTLNEMLAAKNLSNNVNEDNTKPAIKDLKQAINLNQKLLYIKDLFNGYNLAYAEAIDLINKMPDFKTADAFLRNSYAIKNNWAAKQSTVDQFYELLNQRFPQD